MPKIATIPPLRALCIAAFALTVGVPIQAADFCAFKLHVTWAPGAAGLVRVNVIDPSGKTAMTTTVWDERPLAICDLEFGDHTVIVDSTGCFPTTISHVKAVHGESLNLYATVNPCGGSRAIWTGCPVFLRVRTADGDKPIAQATISWRGYSEISTKTDQYGRALMAMPPGISGNLSISADGFLPEVLRLECQREDERFERVVLLTRR